VRPGTDITRSSFIGKNIEFFFADIRFDENLDHAFDEIDVLVHLASAVENKQDIHLSSTIIGTHRILSAMERSQTRVLVFASSLAVYDWSSAKGCIHEESSIETDCARRDDYAVSKISQEKIVRTISERNSWSLVVMRPGFIWGRRHEMVAGLGQSLGRVRVVIGPFARPPMTHVLNCAAAFVTAAEKIHEAAGQTFNVVDGHGTNSWQYVGHHIAQSVSPAVRMPLPYQVGLALTHVLWRFGRIVVGNDKGFPNILIPSRFEARFKPLRCDGRKLRARLGWIPPYSFEECLSATYGESGTKATRGSGKRSRSSDRPAGVAQ
jgi:UDP-glucose 4-epimerase